MKIFPASITSPVRLSLSGKQSKYITWSMDNYMRPEQQDINILLADESFQRWLTQTADEAESGQWREWLNAAPHRASILGEAKALWHAAQFRGEVSPEVESEWLRLQARLKISPEKTATVRALPLRTAAGPRFSWKYWGALAAAAVLVLALWSLLEKKPRPELQSIATSYGERLDLTLSDGSRVTLNANSILRYAPSWNEAKERRVELQGEAYFEIAARAQQPFVVQTRDGEIKVLGTKFVVHEREGGTRVAVQEGRVRVQARADTAFILLTAGELLLFQQQNKKLSPQNANVDFYITWWQEEWRLTGMPFSEIVQRLEETYDVRVEVTDERLLSRKLTGTVENRDLEILLASLATALRVEVKREGDVIKFVE